MPTLQKKPGVLSVAECEERLEKDPNDPDSQVQEYKRFVEKTAKHWKPIIEAEVNTTATKLAAIGIFPQFQKELASRNSFIQQAVSFPGSGLAEYIRTANEANKSVQSMLQIVNTSSELFAPTLKSINALAEIMQPTMQMINSFKMPSHLFDSLQMVAEEFNRLSESTRLLGESFAVIYTPNLFNQLATMKTHWIYPSYVPSTFEPENDEEYEEELIKEKKIFQEEVTKLTAIEPVVLEHPYYYYEKTKTIIFQITGIAAITFYSKSGNTDIEKFISVLLTALEEKGDYVGEYKKVFISLSELISGLISKGIKEPTMEWIKSTRSNIVNHKIPEFLNDVISISEYDKTNKGYYFQIKVRTFAPQLN